MSSARILLGRAAQRSAATPALVYAGIALLAFPVTEMLLSGKRALQYVHDVFDTTVPLNAAFAHDLVEGTASLWSTSITSGNPTLIQGVVAPATPDVWAGLFVPPFTAYFIGVVVLVWLAGYGMHRFLRDSVGLPNLASYAGGVMYALSFWHVVYGFSAPLLPLLLWLTDRLVRSGSKWHLPAAALVSIAALTLWWGHLQVFPLVAVAQLGYLGVLLWGRASVGRILLVWLTIWLIAALLYAPVLVTQIVSLPDSHRSVWNLEYLYDGTVLERINDALFRYRTLAIGIPIAGFSEGTATYYGTWFLGAIGLTLTVLGLLGRRYNRRTIYLAALLAVIPIADVAASVAGPHMDGLGILRSFQLVRVRHLLPFVLAANAAIGFAVLQGGLPAGRRRLIAIACGGVGVVLVGWQVVVAVEQVRAVAGASERLAAGWSIGIAALVLGVAGVALAGLSLIRYRRVGTLVLVGLLFAFCAERAVYARHERLVDTGLGTWTEHLDSDPARTFIADRLDLGDRTLTAGVHPNVMAMSGFRDAAGYLGAYPLGYHAVFGALIDPYLATDRERYRYFHEWGNRAYVFGAPVDATILDMMGVRWIYARGVAFEDTSLSERFRWNDVIVYENRDAFPRAYVVAATRQHETVAQVVQALREADREDLMMLAHTTAEVPRNLSEEAGSGPIGSAEITAYGTGKVQMVVDADASALLVLTDQHAPGWLATIDGAPSEIIRVNGAFRAVEVPAGQSEVTFSYQPRFTHAGLAASGATALGLGVWTLWYGLRHRRYRIES